MTANFYTATYVHVTLQQVKPASKHVNVCYERVCSTYLKKRKKRLFLKTDRIRLSYLAI